jgi:predicted lactoylglutathione lyase
MKQIFINLPITDLEKSKNFYAQLGFTNYPLFTSENQICMAWSEQILVMIQAKSFFNLGNSKSLTDTKNQLSATFTLPVGILEKVNEIIEKGLSAGGKEPIEMIDEGFMQVRSIEDLDGHLWSVIYLDMEKFRMIKKQP